MWDSIQDFADWYFEQGCPMRIPDSYEMIEVDTAAAVTVYREGRYQVELYLLLPDRVGVRTHSHPNMETLSYLFNPETKQWDNYGVIYDLTTHGFSLEDGVEARREGELLLTFERWDEGIPMTNVARQWKGLPDGPKHLKMMRQEYPDAVEGNMIDITKVHRVEPKGK